MADFGVATSGGVGRQDEVVGTPYWIAPEIIEMKQQTPKCDIWSLGCTCIELVTAKPPYWDLEPLPAMWRIVQVTLNSKMICLEGMVSAKIYRERFTLKMFKRYLKFFF